MAYSMRHEGLQHTDKRGKECDNENKDKKDGEGFDEQDQLALFGGGVEDATTLEWKIEPEETFLAPADSTELHGPGIFSSASSSTSSESSASTPVNILSSLT